MGTSVLINETWYNSPKVEISMDTILIVLVLILLLGGGGWYGRGRWYGRGPL